MSFDKQKANIQWKTSRFLHRIRVFFIYAVLYAERLIPDSLIFTMEMVRNSIVVFKRKKTSSSFHLHNANRGNIYHNMT